MVFYLLRSIPSPSESDRPILVREHSRELTLDVLEIIFNWLQVSVSDATVKPFKLNFWYVARDLVLSDRAICTIASRVNSFDAKLSLNLLI